jgi:phosphodiester glycosidase
LTRLARAALALGALIAAIGPASPAPAASFPVPAGYSITSTHNLSPSLVHVQYKSSNPKRVVNVAFLRKGAPEHFRMVVSNERVAGPNPRTETLSSMCKRVKCKIAVNGDFFSRANGQPAGGIAMEGVPVRTPPGTRYHFTQDFAGNVSVRQISMPINLYVTWPAKNPAERYVIVHSINTDRPNERAVAYTTRWGPRTEQSGGFEIQLKVKDLPVRMDHSHTVEIVRGAAGGNGVIPSDGLIISGSGSHATQLANLWKDVHDGRANKTARIVFDSQPGNYRAFMGGTPGLLQNGNQAFTSDGSCFYTCRNPHSMIGRNAAGDAIIAQIDGRQSHSVGFTIAEAMSFMKALGATDAVNLDGGGSSEFVKNGLVISHPSDGRERLLASAITIV